MAIYLLIVIAYVVSGKAALMLALPPGYASAIFPPAGIAIAVAYIWGRQTLPWVFLGSLLLNLWTGYTAGHGVISPTAIGAAFVIAAASTIQASFSGWILRSRIGYPAVFDRAYQILLYLAWSPIICLFSASLSVIGLAMLGVFDKGNLGISWLSWWVGDFLGFLTMFPVVMALAGEPRDLWKGRIKTVAVPMLLLLAAVVALFLKANQWDQEESLNDYRQISQQSLDQITLGLDEQTAIVTQLHGFFIHDANGVVSRQEFRRYCKDTLQKFPMIQAMEWAPKISLSRRKAFELAQQKALPSFRITERNQAGKMQLAGKRDWYYPVTYMQPLTGNKAALGFDLASNRHRRQTVGTATASGRIVASAPIHLVQHGAGMLVIKSVSINGHAAGVVLTVLKMQTFMDAILPSTKRYLYLRLTDVESGQNLYDNFPSSLHRTLYERTYEYGGRRYRLQTLPTGSYYKDHRSWGSWGVLAIGALSTSLIGVLLLLGTGYTARVEAQVRERTIELKESEERFRKTLEHSPIGMCIISMDDRFLQVNQAFCSIVGYEKSELDKLNVRDITHPDGFQRDAKLKQRLIEGKVNSYRNEKRYIRKDGQVIWVQVTSSLESNVYQVPEHLIVQVEDISERKKMERIVQDKLLELQTMLDSASVAITFVKERCQTWSNKRMEELFGYTHEEMAGQSTQMFYRTEEEFEAFGEKAYPALLETGEYQAELEMRHKDGHSLWINFSGKAIAPSDLSMGSIWVLEDITARKQAEEQAEQLQRQFIHSQKLESLGVLAGGVAHDFNNILAVIMGHASMVELKRHSDPLEVQKHCQTIVGASKRAADLCRQLLAYSGQGQIVIQSINLSELVQSSVTIIEMSISNGIQLQLNLLDDLPRIEADSSQIQQIIMNLITNADEAMDDQSGIISINTGILYATNEYLKQCLLPEDIESGNYVFLEVSDTGCGMDSEALGRIFDPFYTTKFTGRGLGLSALLGIVRSQKGAIKVDSNPGHGSSFRILFPAVDHMQEPTSDGVTKRDQPNDRQLSILLVDDEDAVREMTTMMLHDLGYKDVLIAENGQEAINIYRGEKDRISLVLLDFTMPQMDGEETYQQLRSINPDVKVIITSGYSQQSIEDRFSHNGLCGFLQKPYLPSVLQQTIRNTTSTDHK